MRSFNHALIVLVKQSATVLATCFLVSLTIYYVFFFEYLLQMELCLCTVPHSFIYNNGFPSIALSYHSTCTLIPSTHHPSSCKYDFHPRFSVNPIFGALKTFQQFHVPQCQRKCNIVYLGGEENFLTCFNEYRSLFHLSTQLSTM